MGLSGCPGTDATGEACFPVPEPLLVRLLVADRENREGELGSALTTFGAARRWGCARGVRLVGDVAHVFAMVDRLPIRVKAPVAFHEWDARLSPLASYAAPAWLVRHLSSCYVPVQGWVCVGTLAVMVRLRPPGSGVIRNLGTRKESLRTRASERRPRPWTATGTGSPRRRFTCGPMLKAMSTS